MLTTQNHHHQQHNQQQPRALQELSSLVFNILRHPPSPSTLNLSDFLYPPPAISSTRSSSASSVRFPSQITPAGFASLMLGISLALMLCGSVTFFIGFMLLPWVIGLVMMFYFIGLVTSISVLGRTFFCYATSSPYSHGKDFSAWKFL
ncbi:unnamed protein product [Amaranthus hypochondriacus]